MYIVPIAVHDRGPNIKQIHLFLERNGTYLISLDGANDSPVSAAHEFAEVNGLVLSSEPFQDGSLLFLPVDLGRTDMSSFYSWREVPPGTVPVKEVWRQFTWVSDTLNVNTLLNEIVIGYDEHTVYTVLKAYLKTIR